MIYIIITLEIIGLGIALYLVLKRKRNENPVCIIGEKCNIVLKSDYNKIFGIHNDVLGSLYYIFIIFITLILKFNIFLEIPWLILMKLIVTIGAIMALVFIFIQWRIIKSWCFWCIISDINTILISTIILLFF